MEAGWRVGYTTTTHPDAHFTGVEDFVVPKTSTANRAYRAAERGEPIPEPSEPEWHSVWYDPETQSEFFLPWDKANIDALAVEVVQKGADYRVESTSSHTSPPGPSWVIFEKAPHPNFKSQYRRVRRMFWSAA